MGKHVKLGIVGLIRGGSVGYHTIGDEAIKITAICDKNVETLNKVRQRYEEKGLREFKCFTDFDEMLKADVDAVYVATDAICHVPFVLKALDAGKHVISEIPAVNSVKEAEELKRAVKAHPELKYMAGENCFYWAFIQEWKRIYEDNKIGRAMYAEAEYLHSELPINTCNGLDNKNHWRVFNPAIKYVTHDLGPLLYILDDKCVSVTCMESDVVSNPNRNSRGTGVALFKTVKGAVIKILTCFEGYLASDHNFAIIGTEGSLETDKIKNVAEAHSWARMTEIEGSNYNKIEIPVTRIYKGEDGTSGHGGADLKMMRDFARCIIEDTPSPIDVDMAINISLPGIIAAQSAEMGGMPLRIPEI